MFSPIVVFNVRRLFPQSAPLNRSMKESNIFSCWLSVLTAIVLGHSLKTSIIKDHLNKNNYLKANPGKSHILLSSKKLEIVSVDGISIAANSHEKLLGVMIDPELTFENHITEICLKISKKINVLCRISRFYNVSIYRTSIQLVSLDMDASF